MSFKIMSAEKKSLSLPTRYTSYMMKLRRFCNIFVLRPELCFWSLSGKRICDGILEQSMGLRTE
jgi:hypothetical protein